MRRLRYVIAALVVVGIISAFGVIISYLLALRPVDSGNGTTQDFTLEPGTSVSRLAAQLKEANLIRSTAAFQWYVTLHGQRPKLQAGNYEFKTSDSTPKIASKMAKGQVAVNRLTVREGADIGDIRKAAAKHEIKAADLDAALRAPYPNSFLQAKPAAVDLEGYLFPDTYNVAHPPDAHKLVQTMLDNFGKRVATPDTIAALSAQGLDLHAGITLASIVEKEAGKPADQPMIASVFYNRMKAGMVLGSDVTILYAADKMNVPFSTTLDSPYNTYTHKGLPPGPICSPSLTAVQAVAHPAQSDYLYFIADNGGHIHYARTAAEHQANVDKYLK